MSAGAASVATARRQAMAGPLALGGIAVAGALALRLRDPHTSGSWGFCPLQRMTGVLCPGCGGLRAVNDLTHLDLAAAASSNLLVVVLLPVVVAWWARWVARLWRGNAPGTGIWRGHAPGSGGTVARQRLMLVALAGVTLAFTVVRNLATGAWLAP